MSLWLMAEGYETLAKAEGHRLLMERAAKLKRQLEREDAEIEFMRAEVLTMPSIKYRKKKYERHLLAYMYMHNNHMFTVPETVCEGAACSSWSERRVTARGALSRRAPC